jgi:hypothetical protein
MDKIVIEDFYHMTTINENMNWMKLTYVMSSQRLHDMWGIESHI